MEIVFKAKQKIKTVRKRNKVLGNLLQLGINSPEQIGDSIKPLRPLEVFDIMKPLQMEIDKINQESKRKLQDRTNKRADVGLSRFTQILAIPRIKSYLKEKVKQYVRKVRARVSELLKFNIVQVIALFKKAKALDKAIQTLNKALQTPSKHR